MKSLLTVRSFGERHQLYIIKLGYKNHNVLSSTELVDQKFSEIDKKLF
tara:strand:- start:1687 stop:1830 length:144 start_codon:yes stop_codon:yes gene_type:complete